MKRAPEEYIPLNVKTYSQGFLRLQGWICFSCLAFLTAGLLVVYELLLINVEDQDFRDLLFDYRVTRSGVSYQHKYFVMAAQQCCHQDTAVFRYSCSGDSSAVKALGPGGPSCPPTIQFTCPNLASDSCYQLRALLYPAVGLDDKGQPADCSRAGRVMLRARTGPGFKLVASHRGSELKHLNLGPEPSSVNPAEVLDFVDDIANNHSDPMFKLPSAPLTRAAHVDGKQVMLFTNLQDETQDRWGDFGWPWELWPWPPSAPCTKTGQLPVFTMEGGFRATFQPYVTGSSPQPTFRVGIFSDSLAVPQYRSIVEPVMDYGDDGSPTLAIMALTSVNLTIGLLAQLDGCSAWQLHKAGVLSLYDREVWRGTQEELDQLGQPITGGSQTLALSVHDVSEPVPLALPKYAGELYVYVALVLGGVWMFSTVPLIFLFGLMLINVQRNKGLPIFLYKYMRKYRGW